MTSPESITMAQIRAAAAIVTASEISQNDTAEGVHLLGRIAEDELTALYANGPHAAAGAFLALIRPLLRIAAGGNDPDTVARVWQFAIRIVNRAGFPEK